MTLPQAKFIIQIVEDAGETAELYENYSGRGMYGKTTFGVTFEVRDALIFGILINKIIQLAKDGPYLGKVPDELNNLCIDEVGRGLIIY